MEDVRSVEVRIWGQTVGAVAPLRGRPGFYEFQYAPAFAQTGIQLSPLLMPVAANRRFSFQGLGLGTETYRGLPGLLADALPDKFGNDLINAYMARQGVEAKDITTLQRLLYVGKRAIGAIEFEPASTERADQSLAIPLQMAHLVEGARRALRGEFGQIAQDIIDVGSSAGGARAKAVIGWKPDTNEVVSGQFDLPDGFEHWLLKFDVGDTGVLGYTEGFGRIEYAHHLMALEAGVTMNPCNLLEENGRAHFMTKRFDRNGNEKLHLQSLCGLAHLDFNIPYVHSYEQYFRTILNMNLGADAMQQAWLRCAFNVVAVNCDDHTKNLAFLLNTKNEWSLAPAYDVCFSHNPTEEKWTRQHQMLVNEKAWNITGQDLLDLADKYGIKHSKALLNGVIDAVSRWPEFAKEAGVSKNHIKMISAYQKEQDIQRIVVYASIQSAVDDKDYAAFEKQAWAGAEKKNLLIERADNAGGSSTSGVIVAVGDKWLGVEEEGKISVHVIADLSVTSSNSTLKDKDLLAVGNHVHVVYREGKELAQTRGIVNVEERRVNLVVAKNLGKKTGL